MIVPLFRQVFASDNTMRRHPISGWTAVFDDCRRTRPVTRRRSSCPSSLCIRRIVSFLSIWATGRGERIRGGRNPPHDGLFIPVVDIDDTDSGGIANQIQFTMQVQLFQNAGAMVLDGLEADV